jgi:hypothetical protein
VGRASRVYFRLDLPFFAPFFPDFPDFFAFFIAAILNTNRPRQYMRVWMLGS